MVGRGAARRRAQILRLRSECAVKPIRGNAGTRLRKLAEGEYDATLLGLAGLQRIDEVAAIASILSPEEMLPAVAQGAIGVECRVADDATHAFLAPLNDAGTEACIAAERALLAALGGNCRTPIAGLAELGSGALG